MVWRHHDPVAAAYLADWSREHNFWRAYGRWIARRAVLENSATGERVVVR